MLVLARQPETPTGHRTARLSQRDSNGRIGAAAVNHVDQASVLVGRPSCDKPAHAARAFAGR